MLFDRADRKITVPDGKEQADVFRAIQEHLGGIASEQEADVWCKGAEWEPMWAAVLNQSGPFGERAARLIWLCALVSANVG